MQEKLINPGECIKYTMIDKPVGNHEKINTRRKRKTGWMGLFLPG